MTTTTPQLMDEWSALPWKKIELSVFKLQKRIYQASCRGDVKTVRKLQRLLINSRSAKLLSVRRVTQDNQGKKTAGVDGVKSLTPPQRLALTSSLRLTGKAQPVRRVWIPKSGNSNEQRPLGIPVMKDRALQRLVQSALEPEWEARFEPNSYGFRPGRSCHDAIEAIFSSIARKPKYALDADIEKCFDRISHQELLRKLNTWPQLRRQIKAWLKSGVLEQGQLFPTESGTMQGGPLSPLMANVALHGMEEMIALHFPRSARKRFYPPRVIRYADDVVVLHEDRQVIEQIRELMEKWLQPMGLRLKPAKTRITHTLDKSGEQPGFDFLGFNIRQYPKGKAGLKDQKTPGFITLIKPAMTAIKRQTQKFRELAKRHQHQDQATLIRVLNPVITGWSRYFSTVVSKDIFNRMDYLLWTRLMVWAKRRHPHKSVDWIVHKYWSFDSGRRWQFQTSTRALQLYLHSQTPIRRYTKVQNCRSPYDGDWVYWGTRLGRHPEIPSRIIRLLKKQQGRCWECGLFFRYGELMEVDHIIPLAIGGKDVFHNLQLLHRHCHDQKTVRDSLTRGMNDNHWMIEEPDESKGSRPVLKPSGGSDPLA
jgi:RNA-directed DNA polymerase